MPAVIGHNYIKVSLFSFCSQTRKHDQKTEFNDISSNSISLV